MKKEINLNTVNEMIWAGKSKGEIIEAVKLSNVQFDYRLKKILNKSWKEYLDIVKKQKDFKDVSVKQILTLIKEGKSKGDVCKILNINPHKLDTVLQLAYPEKTFVQVKREITGATFDEIKSMALAGKLRADVRERFSMAYQTIDTVLQENGFQNWNDFLLKITDKSQPPAKEVKEVKEKIEKPVVELKIDKSNIDENSLCILAQYGLKKEEITSVLKTTNYYLNTFVKENYDVDWSTFAKIKRNKRVGE